MKIHVAGSLLFFSLFVLGVIFCIAAKLIIGMVAMTLLIVFKVAVTAFVITLLVVLYWKLRKMFSKAKP